MRNEFVCPLSLETFKDPVVAADGIFFFATQLGLDVGRAKDFVAPGQVAGAALLRLGALLLYAGAQVLEPICRSGLLLRDFGIALRQLRVRTRQFLLALLLLQLRRHDEKGVGVDAESGRSRCGVDVGCSWPSLRTRSSSTAASSAEYM